MPYISTEAVAVIRKELKETFPNLKFSVVRKDGMCIYISIMSGDVDFLINNLDVNNYKNWLNKKLYKNEIDQSKVDEINKLLLTIIENIANANNGTESEDGDYGTIPNYYVRISIGNPFTGADYIYTK